MLLELSFVFAIGAHGADLGSTMHCIGARRCREMNPWLARFDHPAAFGFAKMGSAAATELLVAKMATQHPKLAVVANLAIGAAFTGLAWRNARVGSR